ncbi:hypothetical protein [Chamaesiphon polymorphus]|uniref:hypothetical protein n=1 Tax=Chamaesiphon polymorphus TaxID=2107691 RepID=UPI0015E7465C|nr:hypothetical protein [Chamaesiphon polymorphus]
MRPLRCGLDSENFRVRGFKVQIQQVDDEFQQGDDRTIEIDRINSGRSNLIQPTAISS